ncbi:DUF3310 domain-containing protein [Moraxella catarrhalis]|uniref:DUF3310 domain-containing protein n=1 Tax=Moraxella catarrhalis TaxID=480 RepID=A0A198UMJ0_MORCA|nr:DUF3310 domain-containing protein [Moraxella catarrhalis]OAU97560.1 hypothetical protein AO384_0596 [Moraxella catarrhalis]OAU98820.1 hypothetical protein AO383_0386 [Moraxella catarrhalis]OAV02910.1 hypothetical protein AO385_0755 [Moraxella catarrhalis]
MTHDPINQPSHYTSCPSGIECIEIAELLPFCLGNCYKYLHRAGLKGKFKEDMEKARYYANRALFNGEVMPNAVKSRISYVASHEDANNAEMLKLFKCWDVDGDGRLTRAFIDCLTETIDSVVSINPARYPTSITKSFDEFKTNLEGGINAVITQYNRNADRTISKDD